MLLIIRSKQNYNPALRKISPYSWLAMLGGYSMSPLVIEKSYYD